MHADPHCPVCGGHQWRTLSTKVYARRDAERLSSYVKARLAVLFEVWLPGQTEVQVKSVLCTACGFLTFTPRPSASDLDAKYQFLATNELSRAELNVSLQSDATRSEQLAGTVLGLAEPPGRRLLDFGGGNGRLLSRFLDLGFECHVCDYVEQTLPGIRRVGRTLDDLDRGQLFDLIVCSHVLEHVTTPRETVQRLAAQLAVGGLLYAEVPLEIWGEAPLVQEPVTHINFFAPHTLQALCDGLPVDVLDCREVPYTSESGARLPAARLLIRRRADEKAQRFDSSGACAKTMAYVKPSLLSRIRHYRQYPDLQDHLRADWVRRHLPRRFFWRFAG